MKTIYKFIKQKISNFIKKISTLQGMSFYILFSLGFMWFSFNYPYYLNSFEVALISFGSIILFWFVGLWIIADMQYHRITYYRLFLGKYSKGWFSYLNLINPYQTFVMFIVKFRRFFKKK